MIRCFLLLISVAFVSAVVIAALGYLPTVRYAGTPGVVAMLVGCGVSLVASGLGAIPVARASVGSSQGAGTAILAATAIRFLSVLMMIAPLALSGLFHRTALVLWTGISYMLMLLVDTLLAVRVMRNQGDSSS